MKQSDSRPESQPVCRICGSTNASKIFAVREMMFGFRDEFSYACCARCGSISQMPADFDMARYYPPGYYSFRAEAAASWRARLLFKACSRLPDGVVALLHRVSGSYSLGVLREAREEVRSWLGNAYRPGVSILDVGCGAGAKPKLLRLAGFAAEGLDPFYTGPETDECPVHRCELAALDRQYQVLNFNNSFEHMAQPASVLRAAFARVLPGGSCVLTVPKVPSRAFEKYGACWYALDAPRHYFVPSVAGLTELAKSVGFSEVVVQSLQISETHLWSEAYRRGISRQRGSLEGVLTKEEQDALRREAAEAFQANESCSARFILRKPA